MLVVKGHETVACIGYGFFVASLFGERPFNQPGNAVAYHHRI